MQCNAIYEDKIVGIIRSKFKIYWPETALISETTKVDIERIVCA